ncbi:MAG: family 78 glycoside hydrolase catalytic domain [Clostridia bacterium]|nr:family 78 glycoside hydrolase catalytic domain [Clostridia bacterium]
MTFSDLFGSAKFVAASGECVAPVFQSTVTLATKPQQAVITVCGLGFFEMAINGQPVTADRFVPLNSHYHHYDDCYCYKNFGEELAFRIYACRYDVSALLKAGENVLTCTVAPGWYFRYGEPKLCWKLEADGQAYGSDETALWRSSGMTAYSITKGEDYDFRQAHGDWQPVKLVDAPESHYDLSDCPTDKVIRTIAPKKIAETETTVLYDCGENITGTAVFTGGEPGQTYTALFAEKRNENGFLDEECSYGQHLTFVPDGEPREFRLRFTWATFRYVEVTKGADVKTVEVIHADLPLTATFESDNAVLNGLFDIYVRTQLDNMHAGIPSDCPHLERRGYTGDGQLTCETVMLLFDAKAFYQKWMKDISDCQDRVSGHVQYTAPYVQSGGGPGGWGCAIAEVPYVYYKMTGDLTPAKQYFDQMLHYFDYLEAHSENGFVTSDQPDQWCLGDWCTPNTGKHGGRPDMADEYVNNYFYIKTIGRVIELARLIGREEVIPALEAKKRERIAAIMDKYFDAATGNFDEDKNSANAFALDLGLGDERTLKNLADKLDRRGSFDSGIFGTDLVVKLLFENGYENLAARLLTGEEHPSFGYMLKTGATTIWEDWLNPRSMCHPMFGAPVRYLFYDLLGVRQADGAAGMKKIVLDPKNSGVVKRLGGSVRTAGGDLAVQIDWTKKEMTVRVPNGIDVFFGGERLKYGQNELKV